MKRFAMQRLIHWKDAADRRPLILLGVRQVGKTWLMNALAEEFFPQTHHAFNFDLDPDLGSVFVATRSPQAILEALSFHPGRRIESGSLLIFDEVQACPEVIHALKYFCELRPDLRILVAGSLLGLSLARPKSYPVGKVDFMTLEPMTLTEFLLAQEENGLVEMLRSWDRLEPIPELFFNPLRAKLVHFECVGGMPEAAAAWCQRKDVEAARESQQLVLETFSRDIESQADAIKAPKMKRILEMLPQQLARTNRQFRYSLVEPRSNARKYGDALQWLMDARILRAVHRVKTLGLPLSAYEEPGAFKAYFADVGLLTLLCGIEPQQLLSDLPHLQEIKNALAENLVLQSLVCQYDHVPHFWASRTNPSAEVAFLIEQRGKVIPVEVTASANPKSPGLKKYKEAFGDEVSLRVRLSLRNLSLDGDILNIPLFMVDETRRLIDLALDRMHSV